MSLLVGIEKLRFKPAYNPYTEPSMEVFSYHEGQSEDPECAERRGAVYAGPCGVVFTCVDAKHIL